MVQRALLQWPDMGIEARYASLCPAQSSCRMVLVFSGRGSSHVGQEAVREQPAQEGAGAKIFFKKSCFSFI